MVSVLNITGYGPTESLQLFASRFKNQIIGTDFDVKLANVWVCHKSIKNLKRLSETFTKYDCDIQYHEIHSNIPLSKCDYEIKMNSRFVSSRILEIIFSKLHCCLAHYILRECLILYNWGINSFELIIANEEFSVKVASCQRIWNRRGLVSNEEEFRRARYLMTKINMKKNGLKKSSCDMFEEEEVKVMRPERRRRFREYKKLQKIYEQCNKPFSNLRKSIFDPTQEVFKVDKILYSLACCRWFAKGPLSVETGEEMLKFIMKMKIGHSRAAKQGLDEKSTGKWVSLRKIFDLILQNHNTLKMYNGYGRILKRHLKGLDMKEPTGNFRPIPVNVVAAFLMDVMRKVIPLEFFGTNRARKKFHGEIVRIMSGGKNENFIFQPLTQVFLNVKTNLPWIQEIQSWDVAKRVTSKILKWMLFGFIFLILRNNFYVTEIGSSGCRLYYYRKGDIKEAISLWVKYQLERGNLQRITGEPEHWNSIERKWLETGRLVRKSLVTMPRSTEFIPPVANVRFMPKSETGGELRIITSYPKKRTSLGIHPKGRVKLTDLFFNRQVKRHLALRKVRCLLEFLVEKCGTGIRPLPTNPKLEFAWKRVVHLKETHGELYYVKADVRDAFGSVLPGLLSSIIDEKLKDHRTMQMWRIKECRGRNGRIEFSARKSFTDRPKENVFLASRSIIIPRSKKLPSCDSRNLKVILDQLVLNQYLKIDGKCYRLVRGLTQGSAGSFSSLLCEIYYSELDRLHFSEFLTCTVCCVLLRGVDDYLLITSNVEKARKFYDIVYSGIKDFNVTFNRSKLKSNLREDAKTGGTTAMTTTVAAASASASIQYLGLTFNVRDLTVRPDYSKLEQKDILSTMNLCHAYQANFFRRTWFVRFRSLGMISLKLLPLTLNSLYNGVSVVREVVFGASLVQSNRILVLTRRLFRPNEKNDLDVAVILSKGLAKITAVVTRLNRDISSDEVGWLFWNAALAVFRYHPGLFAKLLVVIRYRIFLVEKKFERDGKALLLDYIRKDMKSTESWRELRKSFRLIGVRCKPSNRLK